MMHSIRKRSLIGQISSTRIKLLPFQVIYVLLILMSISYKIYHVYEATICVP